MAVSGYFCTRLDEHDANPIVDGVVVGCWDDRRLAIIHSVGYGRVVIRSQHFTAEIKLAKWFRLKIIVNDGKLRNTFQWSDSCPWMSADRPTLIAALMKTSEAKNRNNASYVMVEGPVLVGAVHNNIAIGFNPHIGRVNLALAEFPNATYEPGVYFMAAIGSIYAADENGFCQWAVRRITDIGAVDIDWGGVRQIQAKFMKIDATMLYLEAEDQSVITAGTVDFVDTVNDGNVRNATSFTVWVGPALPQRTVAVRAFYAKMNTIDDPAPEHRGLAADFARTDAVSPIPDDPRSKCKDKCVGLALIKRMMADNELHDLLVSVDPAFIDDVTRQLSL